MRRTRPGQGGGGGLQHGNEHRVAFVLDPSNRASLYPVLELAKEMELAGHRATLVTVGGKGGIIPRGYEALTVAHVGPCEVEGDGTAAAVPARTPQTGGDGLQYYAKALFSALRDASRRRLELYRSCRSKLAPRLKELGQLDLLLATRDTELAVAHAAQELELRWVSLATELLTGENGLGLFEIFYSGSSLSDGVGAGAGAGAGGERFWDRLRNIILGFIVKVAAGRERSDWFSELQQVGEDLRVPLGSSMTVVLNGFGIEPARVLPPSIAMVGPLIPRPGTLSREELRWLASVPDAGVVVVQCEGGGWSEAHMLSVASGIVAAGARVLWIGNEMIRSEFIPAGLRAADIYSSLSAELADAMAHSSVTAFVGNGFMWPAQVSLSFGKPVVSVVGGVEEERLAERLVHLGVGSYVHLRDVNTSAIENVVALIHARYHRGRSLHISRLLNEEASYPSPVSTIVNLAAHRLPLATGIPGKSIQSEGGNSSTSFPSFFQWAQDCFLDVSLAYFALACFATWLLRIRLPVASEKKT